LSGTARFVTSSLDRVELPGLKINGIAGSPKVATKKGDESLISGKRRTRRPKVR
jgi:hypothetical protein